MNRPKPGASSRPKAKRSGRPGSGPGASRKSGGRPGRPQSGPERRPKPYRKPGRSGDSPHRPTLEGGPERLQKILAQAGLGSRRACEELISQGRVVIDGQIVRELGSKVDPRASKITVDGEPIALEMPVYYAVHKPKGYVSTNNDPDGRPRVIDLLSEVPERLYAVGRLDEASVGLILLTNDGELAHRLAHPRFGVEKRYRAVVAGSPGPEVFEKMTQGVWIAEGKVRARRVKVVGKQGQATVLELVLAEGKNREVRRMMARLGHKVMSLTRVAVGPITLKGLASGESRKLNRREVEQLREAIDRSSRPIAEPSRGSESRGPSRPSSKPRTNASVPNRRGDAGRQRPRNEVVLEEGPEVLDAAALLGGGPRGQDSAESRRRILGLAPHSSRRAGSKPKDQMRPGESAPSKPTANDRKRPPSLTMVPLSSLNDEDDEPVTPLFGSADRSESHAGRRRSDDRPSRPQSGGPQSGRPRSGARPFNRDRDEDQDVGPQRKVLGIGGKPVRPRRFKARPTFKKRRPPTSE